MGTQNFEKIDSLFQQTSSLKPYIPNVILEKVIIDLEDEVVSLLEKEKANFETIESLKSKGFESSDSAVFESENQNENDCHVIEKECDKEENPKIKLKRKRRKRKSSKQNVKQVDDDVSRANNDFVHFSDLDTFSSFRRPKNSDVIWKNKGSFNTSNVGLSVVSVSNLNKNVKRNSRKDLLACNNSHLGETRSDFICNDAMNVSCDSRMNDLLDNNNFFIFDDVNIIISHVSKMPFRKKPRESMHVRSKSNMIRSLPINCPDLSLDHQFGMFKAYDGVFFLHSKDETSEVIISFIKKTQVNLQLQVLRVRTDNDTKFKNKTLVKFFDEVGITQQFSAARTPQQNGVVERRNRTLVEAIHESVHVNFAEISEMASKQFSLEPGLSNLNEKGKSSNRSVLKVDEASKNDLEDLFQDFYVEYFDSSKIMKSSTTNVVTSINEELFHKSIPINMVPNSDEANTSHNVFNERLEDAYFDASTSFHDSSNVHTYYQSYPYEKKWTKDHPLHKIIGDPKSSVQTRGQLENSCLFSCLLSSIEPANMAEALRDADWVSAMQEELDQFARLKIQVAQKKVKIAFENADLSSKVELITSKIKYAIKVVLNFHNEFSVFSSLSRKENDGLLQDQVFKNREEVVIEVT
nr:retrovirus-related Pol polyprotein from transposon TNT 1-94 [Tanacetum cinerariifolium]